VPIAQIVAARSSLALAEPFTGCRGWRLAAVPQSSAVVALISRAASPFRWLAPSWIISEGLLATAARTNSAREGSGS
jgi:hypothetical protein